MLLLLLLSLETEQPTPKQRNLEWHKHAAALFKIPFLLPFQPCPLSTRSRPTRPCSLVSLPLSPAPRRPPPPPSRSSGSRTTSPSASTTGCRCSPRACSPSQTSRCRTALATPAGSRARRRTRPRRAGRQISS
jgi:hypothetical protein